MSEKIKEVSDALQNECLAVFGSIWSNDVAARFARAAIVAMREPTEAMSDAGGFWYEACLNQAHHSYKDCGAIIFRAMIDKALEP